MSMSGSGLMFFLILWIAIILIAVAIPIVIGALVYRDARRQEIAGPLAWALAAALAPSFIGLVIYLVVRSSGGKET